MGLTKRELEDLNEELQLEIGRLRAENTRLANTLARTTEQYRQLSARTERLERRYARLRDLLIASLGETATTG